MRIIFRAFVMSAMVSLVACDSGGSSTKDTNDASTASGMACADVYTAGWDKTLAESDFSSSAAFAAYQALNQCACVATNGQSPAGCENICTQFDNGTTTPNFCDGVSALFSCSNCLQNSCAAEVADCMAN